ncbi:MAG: zinc ribbon domain-containing protein [Terriglobales bacterium]
MPIFEYICKDCRKRFEALVYGSQQPQCPLCRSTNLEQQISTFAVGATRTRASAAAAACDAGAT